MHLWNEHIKMSKAKKGLTTAFSGVLKTPMFQCHSMVHTFEVKNDDFFIAQFESVDGKLFSQYEFKYSSH